MKKQAGFSLVELLVVISVIGILAALLVTNFVGIRERAADTKRKNDVEQLKKALRIYYNDHQNYPSESGLTGFAGCGPDGDDPCGTSFSDGGDKVYMKELPTEFQYYSDGDEYFLLRVTLDNASDESAAASQARCDTEILAQGLNASITETDYVVCQD